MDLKDFGFKTSSNYFIYQQMWNILGMKSKHFQQYFLDPNTIFYNLKSCLISHMMCGVTPK